jgi:hypothetical protein
MMKRTAVVATLAAVPLMIAGVGYAEPGEDAGKGETKVTLHLIAEGHGFSGKLSTKAKCRKHRKVTFLRSALGSDFFPYGSAVRTNKKGKYSSDQFYDRGNYDYKAQVTSTSRNGSSCPAALSKAVSAGG